MPTDNDPQYHRLNANRYGQERQSHASYKHRPMHSSRIPPSEPGPYEGTQSRDGSLTNKLLFWGGAGVLAAATTAAAVLAARKLTDAISGDDSGGALTRHQQQPLAPRFADLDEKERESIRRRDRDRAQRERNRVSRMRAMAARERVTPRQNFARDMTDQASNLSGSLNGLVGSLTGAMAGFRQVAGQAGGIMREFSDAADAVRGFLDRPQERQPDRDRNSDEGRSPDRDDRTHRL